MRSKSGLDQRQVLQIHFNDNPPKSWDPVHKLFVSYKPEEGYYLKNDPFNINPWYAEAIGWEWLSL